MAEGRRMEWVRFSTIPNSAPAVKKLKPKVLVTPLRLPAHSPKFILPDERIVKALI